MKIKTTTDIFVEKANIKHGNLYSYTNTNYIKSNQKLVITRPLHGDFMQTPNNHLAKKGCPKCGEESKGGYSKAEWVRKVKNRTTTFYILRCFNKDEEFYKVGITVKSIKVRYSGLKRMPYAYEVVSEIRGEAGFIWDLEKEEKIKLKEFSYRPQIKFGSSKTECFNKIKL